jgi:hypothetical protein
MPVLSQPAFGPRTALAYVTGGTLLCVWTVVWYCTRDYALSRSQWFWVAGLFLTGTTFIFLGMVLGPLGRAARQAELPPHGALAAEAAIQQTAAAHPPAVVVPQMAAAPGAPVTAVATGPTPTGTAPTAPIVPAPPVPPVQVSPAR